MTGASPLCHTYYNKDLLPTSLKFLCCGESLFYLFDSKHENVVINYHYNCSSWNEKWWFVFHFSANVFSPEVILDKYLFRAHVFWNKAGSALCSLSSKHLPWQLLNIKPIQLFLHCSQRSTAQGTSAQYNMEGNGCKLNCVMFRKCQHCLKWHSSTGKVDRGWKFRYRLEMG